MNKIIQLLEHKGDLLALSDDGKVFFLGEYRDCNVWLEHYPSLFESAKLMDSLLEEAREERLK